MSDVSSVSISLNEIGTELKYKFLIENFSLAWRKRQRISFGHLFSALFVSRETKQFQPDFHSRRRSFPAEFAGPWFFTVLQRSMEGERERERERNRRVQCSRRVVQRGKIGSKGEKRMDEGEKRD